MKLKGALGAPKEAPRDLKRATALIEGGSMWVNFDWLGYPKYNLYTYIILTFTYFVQYTYKVQDCRTGRTGGLHDGIGM